VKRKLWKEEGKYYKTQIANLKMEGINMPTYVFKCEECGYEFEEFRWSINTNEAECPVCGSSAKIKITSEAGIIFKGSGFYATDYKNKSYDGKTCCGRSQRCDKPPCSDDGVCKR